MKEYFVNPIMGFFTATDGRRVHTSVLFDPNSIKHDLFP